MKILIAISVVLSFSITILQGQSYHPLPSGNNNYWYYALNVIPVKIINNQPAAFGNCTYPIYGNDVVDHIFTEKETTIS